VPAEPPLVYYANRYIIQNGGIHTPGNQNPGKALYSGRNIVPGQLRKQHEERRRKRRAGVDLNFSA
jgi:hypothetical protein